MSVSEREYINVAQSLFDSKDYQKALSLCQKALLSYPQNFHLNHIAAKSADSLGLQNDSIVYWGKLFNEGDPSEYLYLKYIKNLIQLNRLDEARVLTRQGILAHPKNEYLFSLILAIGRKSVNYTDEDISFLLDCKYRNQIKSTSLNIAILEIHKNRKEYTLYFDFLSELLSESTRNQKLVNYQLLIDLARNGWYSEVSSIFRSLSINGNTDVEFVKAYFQLSIELKHLSTIYNNPHFFDLTNTFKKVELPFDESKNSNLYQELAEYSKSLGQETSQNLEVILNAYKSMIDNLADSKGIGAYTDSSSTSGIVEWLRNRISEGVPTSFIRIGDGEACFLPYKGSENIYRKEDQDFIQNIWWGNHNIDPNEMDYFENSLLTAISNADLIGIPPLRRIVKDLQCYLTAETNRVMRNMKNIYLHFSENKFESHKFTSAHLHTDLEKYEMYREMLSGLDECSIITCHRGISKLIKEKYCIHNVEEIIVPGEAKYRSMFSQSPKESHHLDYFNQINNSTWQKKVYLVAAGFLGKIYCDNIKKAGGIAIDIGAITDYWMGFKTRDFHADLRLPSGIRLKKNMNIWNESKPNITKNASFNYFSDCQLSVSNSETDLSYREYLITAHPRCGTKYISNVFKSLGLRIGHEQMEEDGISSWQLVAPNNLSMRFKDQSFRKNLGARNLYEFAHKIHLVRHYLSAVSSIVLENENSDSYNFRRAQIYLYNGIDLDQYSSIVEKALASYVYWNKLAMSQGADVVVRLEHLKSDLKKYFVKRDEPELCKKLLNNHSEGNHVNSSWVKHINPKPILVEASFDKCDQKLMEELELLNIKFGYKI